MLAAGAGLLNDSVHQKLGDMLNLGHDVLERAGCQLLRAGHGALLNAVLKSKTSYNQQIDQTDLFSRRYFGEIW